MALPDGGRIVGGPAAVGDAAALARLIGQIIDLDHRCYAIESHGHIGTCAQWLPVFQRHPDTWRALVDAQGAVVAYWQIAALKPAEYARARQGLLHPTDLSADAYEPLTRPGRYDLYFASVCIAPEWRKPATYWRLFDALFEVAENLARAGVYFDEMAATAHSIDGRQMCLAFGLEYLGLAPDHGECFAGPFRSVIERMLPMLARRRPGLLGLYGLAAGAKRGPDA